jgi:hypothetical protein
VRLKAKVSDHIYLILDDNQWRFLEMDFIDTDMFQHAVLDACFHTKHYMMRPLTEKKFVFTVMIYQLDYFFLKKDTQHYFHL